MTKWETLHLGQGKPKHKKQSPGQGLRVQMYEKLNINHHSVLAIQKVNCILGCNKRCVSSRSKILPLCSALVRPHLEYRIQIWVPQRNKYIELLDSVQKRMKRMIREVKLLS